MPVPEDDRITRLREATEAMVAGHYRVQVAAGGGDDVASLGTALALLGQTLEHRFAEVSTLSALTEKVNAGLLVEEILDHVFASFRSIIPYDRIGFSSLEDQGRLVRAVWARSVTPGLKLEVGYTAPLAGSTLRRVIETGRPRIINDLEAHLEAHPGSTSTRLIVEEGVRSSLTCPLVAMGKPVGFLFFSSFAKDTYERAHVDTFMQVAGHLSLIVEKGRVYQELAETKRQLEEANQKLRALAMIDGLTGIPNRRALDARLALAWRRCARHGTPLTLVMVDIDSFKAFNDRFGHLAGDECLRRVAAALQGALRRPDDFVGRYGGEEFLVVAERTNVEGGAQLAELLRAGVEVAGPPASEASPDARVTISLGVACAETSRGGRARRARPGCRPRALSRQGERAQPRRVRGGSIRLKSCFRAPRGSVRKLNMQRTGRVVAGALLLALAMLGVAPPARGEVDPALAHGKLAVLEFRNKLTGKDREELDPNYFADVVRSASLKALPGLGVITRENLIVLLAATGKKAEECEGECEVDTGRRIGADLVISGDLVKIGTNFKLNLRLHETHTGSLINGAVASGKTVDELDERTSAAVHDLLQQLRDAAQANQASAIDQDVRAALGEGPSGGVAPGNGAPGNGVAASGVPAGATQATPEPAAAADDKPKPPHAAPAEALPAPAPAGPMVTSTWRKVGYGAMCAGVLLGGGSVYFALRGKSLTNSITNGGLASGAEIASTAADAKGTNGPAVGLAAGAGLTLVAGALLAIFSPSQPAPLAVLSPSLDGLVLAGRF